MQKQNDIGPRVNVEQASRHAGSSADLWVMGWRIENLGANPIQLLTARLPHSRFRSGETELKGCPRLLPGENVRLELSVTCRESPGNVVENAFLILHALWLERPWRILARLRVVFDEKGAPETVTELVTTQAVGFSKAQESE